VEFGDVIIAGISMHAMQYIQ